MADDLHTTLDTLRLSPQERLRVMDDIQRATPSLAPKQERRRVRVKYHHHVVVILKNPDGGTVRYAVMPRNLSTHGMGFIHGQYLHEDRPCQVVIPNLRKEWVMLTARIRACKHLTKLLHEVRLVFDEPIDLEDYVQLTPDEAIRHVQERGFDSAQEAAAAYGDIKLAGQAIVADDHPTDRKLYSLWLEELGLTVHPVQTSLAINDILDRQAVDLLLLDATVSGQSAMNIIQQLRLGGYHTPIVMVTPDETSQHHAQALAAGATTVLSKPVDRGSMHHVIEKHLRAGQRQPLQGQERRLQSMYAQDVQMKPLVQAFILEVRQLAEQIHEARNKQDVKSLMTHCLRLKDGASYGFIPVTRLARRALDQLGPGASVIQAQGALDDLLAITQRITAY